MLNECRLQNCYLEFNLIGDLSLWDANIDDDIPAVVSPYLEWRLSGGQQNMSGSGGEIQLQDIRPVVESVGESGGYSVRNEITLEEDVLIPTASSPIGR